jgi:hypothetical protein
MGIRMNKEIVMKTWIQKHPLLSLCLLASLLLSACAPAVQPAATTSEPAVNTPTVEPPPATQAPPTAAPQPEATFLGFGRTFSFSYDPSLTASIEALTVDAVAPSPEVMFSEAHPAFVQFSFLGYDGGRPNLLPYPIQTPRLMAFSTQDFSQFGAEVPTGFSPQLEALSLLLETKPDLAQYCTRTEPVSAVTALPFLPWLNSAQVFCAQPQYVEFAGGSGIRYLTAFSQGIEPVLDPNVFYTFQGLSDDGEIYISAVFAVQTGVFPLEIHPSVDGSLPKNMTPEQLAALNAQAADLFQPALGQLDALVQSLKIE